MHFIIQTESYTNNHTNTACMHLMHVNSCSLRAHIHNINTLCFGWSARSCWCIQMYLTLFCSLNCCELLFLDAACWDWDMLVELWPVDVNCAGFVVLRCYCQSERPLPYPAPQNSSGPLDVRITNSETTCFNHRAWKWFLFWNHSRNVTEIMQG